MSSYGHSNYYGCFGRSEYRNYYGRIENILHEQRRKCLKRSQDVRRGLYRYKEGCPRREAAILREIKRVEDLYKKEADELALSSSLKRVDLNVDAGVDHKVDGSTSVPDDENMIT